jgi:hypothetical protein
MEIYVHMHWERTRCRERKGKENTYEVQTHACLEEESSDLYLKGREVVEGGNMVRVRQEQVREVGESVEGIKGVEEDGFEALAGEHLPQCHSMTQKIALTRQSG